MEISDDRHKEKMRKKQVAREKIMANKTAEKGSLIVHTGRGEGKTTAALGMVIRAIAHGQRVGIVQFVKGPMGTAEKSVFDLFPDRVDFKPMSEGCTWNTQDRFPRYGSWACCVGRG